MKEQKIIVFKTGSITHQRQTALKKKGFILIETDSPDELRIVEMKNVKDDPFFMSALAGLANSYMDRDAKKFVTELYSRLNQTVNHPHEG